MGKTKCKERNDKKPEVKESHNFVCKRCGNGAKKESRLCKPKKMSRVKPEIVIFNDMKT